MVTTYILDPMKYHDDPTSKTEYRVVVDNIPTDLNISAESIDISEDVLTAIFKKSSLSEPWHRYPTKIIRDELSFYLKIKITWLRSYILTGELYRNSHRIAIIINSGILAKKQDKSVDGTPNELYLMLWWNKNCHRWSLIDPKLSIIPAHVALSEEKMRHRISQIIALANQNLQKQQKDPVISGSCCLSSAMQDLNDRLSEKDKHSEKDKLTLRYIRWFPKIDFQLTGNRLPSTIYPSNFFFDTKTRVVIDHNNVDTSPVEDHLIWQLIMQNAENPAQCQCMSKLEKAVEKAAQIARMIPDIAILKLPFYSSLGELEKSLAYDVSFFLPLCFDESFIVKFAALLKQTDMKVPGPKRGMFRVKGYGGQELVYKVKAVFSISEAGTYARLIKPFSSDDTKPDTWLIHRDLSKILTPTQQDLIRDFKPNSSTTPWHHQIVSLNKNSSTTPRQDVHSTVITIGTDSSTTPHSTVNTTERDSATGWWSIGSRLFGWLFRTQ